MSYVSKKLVRKSLCGTPRCEAEEEQRKDTTVLEIRNGAETVSIIASVLESPGTKEDWVPWKTSGYDLFSITGDKIRSPGEISYYMCGCCGGIITNEDGSVVKDPDTIAEMLVGSKQPGKSFPESKYRNSFYR